jgi:hypothetical protein
MLKEIKDSTMRIKARYSNLQIPPTNLTGLHPSTGSRHAKCEGWVLKPYQNPDDGDRIIL